MKGIQFTVMFAIILLVLAAVVYFVWGGNISNMLGGINWSDKVLQNNVENQEKELQKLYDDYKSNDGGFDAYETSILLAKAVEFTWTDCYNICKDDKELFTGFFLKNPIDFSKATDCSKQYPGGIPSINKIKNPVDVCYNNFIDVSEVTVTIWGLSANTEMCSNYKLSNNEGNKQWGNADCGGDFIGTSPNKHYCNEFCDKSGAGIDKVDWQAEKMQKGSKYGNIRIIYSPKAGAVLGIGGEPKIIVKEISAGFDFSLALNPASGSVAKGSSIASTVSTTLASGTSESVSFSCSGLPSGASCSFNPSSLKPAASSALTISTLPSTPVGNYEISVTGTNGIVSQAKTYTLTVTN